MAAASPANVEIKPLTEQEQRVVTLPSDQWSASRAASIAVTDFNEMENARRSMGHDRRFSTADELYLGYQPQKTWEGTRIPRSSLGVPISMDQVEALMPSIMSSIFPLRDNVQVWPQPGTSPEEATATYDLLMYQIDDANTREVFRQAAKSGLIYGNGIMEVYWDYKWVKRKRLIASWVAPTKTVIDPIAGVPKQVQSGQPRKVFHEVQYDHIENRPRFKNVDVRDFYIDPNCPSPRVSDARFCGVRSTPTLGDLKQMRNTLGVDGRPLYNIPDDAKLYEMAKSRPQTYGDTMKTTQDVYRGVYSQPANDYTSNPDAMRLELIRYYTKDRCVWMLNRNWVMYNAANPYGSYPFINAFYVDVPNRFYGLAVTDVVEGEQRLQQAVINARLDELALILHSPFVKKRGSVLGQGAMRIYPGKVIELDNPKEDFQKVEYPGVTSNAYVEVEASDRRAQKRTGVTDLAVLGAPTAGGNSANRTATGVNAQASASGARLRYQVENMESNVIEPLLKLVHKMNQQFLDPQQMMQVLGPEGQALQIDPMNVINADVKFIIRASEKMRSRQTMLQMFPLLAQTFLNPAMLQLLGQTGTKANLKGWVQVLCDAMQIPTMELFTAMSPQELQMLQQQQMAPKMMDAQMQQQRLQAHSDDLDEQNDTKIAHAIISKFATPQILEALTGVSHKAPLQSAPNKAKSKA